MCVVQVVVGRAIVHQVVPVLKPTLVRSVLLLWPGSPIHVLGPGRGPSLSLSVSLNPHSETQSSRGERTAWMRRTGPAARNTSSLPFDRLIDSLTDPDMTHTHTVNSHIQHMQTLARQPFTGPRHRVLLAFSRLSTRTKEHCLPSPQQWPAPL